METMRFVQEILGVSFVPDLSEQTLLISQKQRRKEKRAARKKVKKVKPPIERGGQFNPKGHQRSKYQELPKIKREK